MTRPRRLSGQERRAAIIAAVREVFAVKGFHGTTTRELAEAAGVSEALLFKHFPTKEELHEAVLRSVLDDELGRPDLGAMADLEPSAESLVLLVHGFYAGLLSARNPSGGRLDILPRLMFQSAMSDGDFARLFLREVPARWVAKVAACVRAATAEGEIPRDAAPPDVRAWFAHHLAVMLLLHHLPEPPTIDYGIPRDRMVEHAVRFALRGIGLPDEAIRRLYDPRRLANLAR
jgi:AcrR family transcriptional regulator